MAFFNEPLIVVTPLSQDTLASDTSVNVVFHYTDINQVYDLEDYDTIQYYMYTKTGRDTKNITSLQSIIPEPYEPSGLDDELGDELKYPNGLVVNVTPTNEYKEIYFMFRFEVDSTVYWISTEHFTIMKAGL